MTNYKITYSFNPVTGEYCGETTAWESPLEPETFLIPASSTDIKPTFEEGMVTKWNGNEWILKSIQIPLEPQPLSLEEKKKALKYQLISARKSYLSKTDWYIAKEFDQPNSYPQEIKNKRVQARQEINDIEDAATLTVLNQFNINYN